MTPNISNNFSQPVYTRELVANGEYDIWLFPLLKEETSSTATVPFSVLFVLHRRLTSSCEGLVANLSNSGFFLLENGLIHHHLDQGSQSKGPGEGKAVNVLSQFLFWSGKSHSGMVSRLSQPQLLSDFQEERHNSHALPAPVTQSFRNLPQLLRSCCHLKTFAAGCGHFQCLILDINRVMLEDKRAHKYVDVGVSTHACHQW